MAEQGYTAEQIVRYYYPGTTFASLGTGPTRR
jgi:peptidoglycan hydrolase-like amidase